MYEQLTNPKENKSRAIANSVAQKKSNVKQSFGFTDNRPEAFAQRKLQDLANNHSAQQQNPIQKKENNTGLPDNLKSGIENLSGYSMDDVKVHYNSDKPAQLQAHAYAQGTDIHLASGQEKHFPHEAWHVVQQKQGRVKPTAQLKSSININDDAGLEKEADVMGAKALQYNQPVNDILLSPQNYQVSVQKVDWDWWGDLGKKVVGETAGAVGGLTGGLVGAGTGLIKGEGIIEGAKKGTKAGYEKPLDVVGETAGLVGGLSGGVVGAGKGWWKGDGIVKGARQGAYDGYEHPLTATGALVGGGLAATYAGPLTLITAAATGLGMLAGSYKDKKDEQYMPDARVGYAPNFTGNVRNDVLAALWARQATSSDVAATAKANVLERSGAPIFRYGRDATTDERVDVTGGASYLHKQNKDWAAELKARQSYLSSAIAKVGKPRADQKMSWEVFQDGVGQISPYPAPPPAPWFMGGGGYNLVRLRNQNKMTRIGHERTQRLGSDAATSQEKFGGTYQHDVGAYANAFGGGDRWAVNANSVNGNFVVGNVLVLGRHNRQTCIEITSNTLAPVVNPYFTVRGRVLRSANHLLPYNTGDLISLAADGVAIFSTPNAVNGWQNIGNVTAHVVSQKYYQSMIVPGDYLGEAMGAKERNRGPQVLLDDNTFETLQDRMDNRGLDTALGPWRGNDTWDGSQLDFNVDIAEYRRLGGDVIFQEAQHNNRLAYNPQIGPSSEAETTNPDWYYQRSRSMEGRFVGGRSNSTLGYMSTGTVLYHDNLLNLAQAKDILAFVIADMVVSGEHSLPECITTVVQAGAGMAPWNQTGLHNVGGQQAFEAWLRLVNASSKSAMENKTREQLVNAFRQQQWNYQLIRVLTILSKELYNSA